MKEQLLILERSSQNLQKITKNGKTMLEGVFAEFGVENRNGRIYEEKEYLPHLEYLKHDVESGNLLGELDHPERFEVALGNVSHRVTELWYDQNKRQILGRLEVFDGTPKGQIAKSLLEAGVPLSISSRAAGTVNEDKTVSIQQIYTYDLVAKPGFENAQLKPVNESANPNNAKINRFIQALNESTTSRKKSNISSKFGIVNENISIIDVTDKFPAAVLREEAKQIIKNNESNMEKPNLDENAIQEWTVLFKKELGEINERLKKIEESSTVDNSKELDVIKKYVEKIRKIQEDSLNWQSEIAVAVNEVATYADTLAEKSNNHYKLTKKISETVDYNAEALNHTQDWTGEVAKVTNAIGETVDYNATMLNGLNEWSTQIAKGVNSLNEWGQEKAKAINGIHEWTSSIAKNLNHSVNWTEDMFGRAISKEDAMKLLEYIELVAESKKNPELKNKIEEMLKTHSITAKPLNEANLKGISVIAQSGNDAGINNAPNPLKAGLKVQNKGTALSKTVDVAYEKNTGVYFDEETKTIRAKNIKGINLKKEKLPQGHNDKLQFDPNKAGGKLGKAGFEGGLDNAPKELRAGLKVTRTAGPAKVSKTNPDAGLTKQTQNLKLDTKPSGKGFLTERKTSLDDKLSKIIETLEKEKSQDQSVKNDYPFTTLLSEEDRTRFAGLDATDKEKVTDEIAKVPTTDSKTIVKLWENALAKNKVEEPLWLQLAPKAYREAFDKSDNLLKENIKARAEFYTLNTVYQIENFWETSGVITRPAVTLNESVLAKTPEESEQKLDTFVASIGEQLKKYYE